MKSTTLVIAVAIIAMFAQSAQAREYHYRHHHHWLVSRNFAKPRSGWTPGGEFAWQPRPYAAPGGFGEGAAGSRSGPAGFGPGAASAGGLSAAWDLAATDVFPVASDADSSSQSPEPPEEDPGAGN